MSQMPNATPQGLQGLMQQRPQAPQTPTPGKASPMAGLGSVDDRVSAYMGNPKPLEQRYAMTQDLLDLLALQKIKSQKEAAARQMQLQMAQQNAQDGQANMTVAQQREQEVNEMTKNELAQQRGDTAQKQAGDQQAAMQKLMSGIAGAPGANAAAQPKAMAAGGIVGYAGGGDVDAARARRRAAQQKLQSFGTMQRRTDPEAYAAAQQELEAAQAALQEAEGAYASEMATAGVDRPAFSRRDVGAVRGAMQEAAGPSPTPGAPALPSRPASVSEAQATAAAGPQAVVPPPAPSVVKAPPVAPPAAPKPPGIAGLPGAAGPAAPAVPTFGDRVKQADIAAAELDYMKQGRDEEARVEKRMALTPEQRAVYDEGIAGLQKMYQEQYDPERQRQEGIKRALIGAGGRRYGEFAGAARAGMAYDDQQRAAKLKEFGDVQKARTGLIDLDRANVKGAIDAGAAVAKEGAATKRQGLASATSVYSTDVGSSDKALDREIERLKVAAQNAATAAARENLSFDKARTVYSATVGRVQELERRLDDDFAKQNGMLLMAEQSGKMDAAQKNQLDTAKIQLQIQKAKIRREMEPVLESARSKLGVTSTDGFGEMKQVPKK